jgi:hypothetical protein
MVLCFLTVTIGTKLIFQRAGKWAIFHSVKTRKRERGVRREVHLPP